MLVIAILFLAVVCWWNWHIARSLLYPPATFAGLWMSLLLGIFVFRNFFYPISPGTLFFYFWGAAAFSLGGMTVLLLFRISQRQPASLPPVPPQYRRSIRRTLDVLLLLLIAGIPVYYHWVSQLATESRFTDFWVAVRDMTIQFGEEEGARSISLLENLAPLSIIAALLVYYEDDGTLSRRIRTWLAIAVSMVCNLMTASRSGAILLLLCIVTMSWLRARRVNWKMMAIAATLFLVFFSTIEILVQKGDNKKDASIADNIDAIATDLAVYGLGAVVTFDRIHQDPNAIPPVWNINRVFLQAANKFGADYEVPSLHAEYTPIAPYRDTNVYTMYFAYYPHYGLAGTTLIMMFLGGLATWVYFLSLRGNLPATLMYPLLFAGMLLSGYNEQFFMNANIMAKLILGGSLLYYSPRIWHWLRYPRVRPVMRLPQSGTSSV